MLHDGVERPTARQVAERARVSPRLVFHHFEDMEAVLRSAVAIQVERHWRNLHAVSPEADLGKRVSDTVKQRIQLYDSIAPVRRAAGLAARHSPTLASQLDAARRMLRSQLRHTFSAELAACEGPDRFSPARTSRRVGGRHLVRDVGATAEPVRTVRDRCTTGGRASRRRCPRRRSATEEPTTRTARIGGALTMEILRTPEERFADLPGFDFKPHYAHIPAVQTPVGAGAVTESAGTNTLRVHYIDEGPRDASETLLLMHGEPSWCYLYREMVPAFVSSGFRVVAPDLVGFGRSDKPAPRTDYTYERHVEWMRSALVGRLELRNVTLVCQDWGGLIGLRLVASHPERFRRVVAANTGLPTGDTKITEAFLAWQRFSQEVPEMPIGSIDQRRDDDRPGARSRRRLRRTLPRRGLQGGGTPVPGPRADHGPTIRRAR